MKGQFFLQFVLYFGYADRAEKNKMKALKIYLFTKCKFLKEGTSLMKIEFRNLWQSPRRNWRS